METTYAEIDFKSILKRARKLGKTAGKSARAGRDHADGIEKLPGRLWVANQFDELEKTTVNSLRKQRNDAEAAHDVNDRQLEEFDKKITEAESELSGYEAQFATDSQKPIDQRNTKLETRIMDIRTRVAGYKESASNCRIDKERLEQRLTELDEEISNFKEFIDEKRESAVHEHDIAYTTALNKRSLLAAITGK